MVGPFCEIMLYIEHPITYNYGGSSLSEDIDP